MENDFRSEKLEATFLQFIELVAHMRAKQKIYREVLGSESKRNMERSQERVDNVLREMGIPEDVVFNYKGIHFVNKIQVK